MQPDCFECKYGGLGHPCRTAAGAFDVAKVANAILGVGRAYAEAMESGREPELDASLDWVSDCEYEAIEDHPHLMMPLISAGIGACRSGRDAGFLAAGLIENALVKHGPKIIGEVEALAATSAKVRYVLSGVWRQNEGIDEAVWHRLAAAVAAGPVISNDDRRNPGFGLPSDRLADSERLAQLFS